MYSSHNSPQVMTTSPPNHPEILKFAACGKKIPIETGTLRTDPGSRTRGGRFMVFFALKPTIMAWESAKIGKIPESEQVTRCLSP